MRVYEIRCPGCGWKAPLPVDEVVASEFRKRPCQDCYHQKRGTFAFEIKEIIKVGPVQFFPHRGKEVKQ